MSFSARIILGNAVVVVVTVTTMALLSPMNSAHMAMSAGVGLTLLAGSSLILWLLCRSAFRPLKTVTDAIEKAAGGDLAVRVPSHGFGEISRLGIAFNTMMNDMNKAMRQFFSVADLVRDSVSMVGSTTDAMVAAAEDVAMQAGTIATASEEMSATSGDIARNCLYAAENAKKATDQTHDGAQLVQGSSRLMDNIARRVLDSSRTVEGLGDRSDQIGAIVNTIEDIADQTNLLALNAAIEAARAGEQGRGFAVVADEVRALAERTTKATKEIGAMIRSIQTETQAAVVSMSEGVEEVHRGTAETARSGEALEDILTRINEVTDQVNQIATAAEEQTATTQEITSNIQMITEVVGRNVRSARSTTDATSKLAQQVDELHALVSHFRLARALEWDESFATGVRSLDDQHRRLFDMVNDLHDAMQQKRSREAVGSILGRLIEYTASHFAAEEEGFRRTGYPEEAQHRTHHARLVEQVLDLQRKFNSGEALLTQSVIEFLQDW
ncbi:MAG TPA: bacteriohemerythrin, partial [Desulfuromonadaceae bacterium]